MEDTRDGKVIYELELPPLTSDQKYEGTPQRYSITECDYSASGIMIWGQIDYDGENGNWYPNPACRQLVATLLRQLSNSELLKRV